MLLLIESVDNEAPVIANVPDPITQDTDFNSATATVTWTVPTTTDNSGEDVTLSSTHDPGDNFNIGTTTVTYTVTDLYSNIKTESFDVTVNGKMG